MYYGGGETLRKYDNFKEELFGQKKQQYKNNYADRPKKPAAKLSDTFRPTNHPFLKKSLTACVVFGLCWFIEDRFNVLKDLKAPVNLNPVLAASLNAIKEDALFRFQKNQGHKIGEQYRKYFATEMFLSSLETDLLAICKINAPRKITCSENISLSLGPFKFGTGEEKTEIDEHGNVVKETKFSKMKIGDVCLVGRRNRELIKYQSKTDDYLKNDSINPRETCEQINLINKWTLPDDEYEKVLEFCTEKSSQVLQKINKQSLKRKNKAEKYGGKYKFFLIS